MLILLVWLASFHCALPLILHIHSLRNFQLAPFIPCCHSIRPQVLRPHRGHLRWDLSRLVKFQKDEFWWIQWSSISFHLSLRCAAIATIFPARSIYDALHLLRLFLLSKPLLKLRGKDCLVRPLKFRSNIYSLSSGREMDQRAVELLTLIKALL